MTEELEQLRQALANANAIIHAQKFDLGGLFHENQNLIRQLAMMQDRLDGLSGSLAETQSKLTQTEATLEVFRAGPLQARGEVASVGTQDEGRVQGGGPERPEHGDVSVEEGGTPPAAHGGVVQQDAEGGEATGAE